MTTFERETCGFDAQHADELRAALIAAITETSKDSDTGALVLHTAEITTVLLDLLVLVLCMSPPEARNPTAIGRLTDSLRKRLQRRVAAAQGDPAEIRRRCFTGGDVAGHA
jgi:hypothetical protein